MTNFIERCAGWSRISATILVQVGLAACQFQREAAEKPEPDVLRRLGYETSLAGRAPLEKAIRNVDLILDPKLGVQLVASWQPPENKQNDSKPSTGNIELNSQTTVLGGFRDLVSPNSNQPRTNIVVYLVCGKNLVETDVSFVPTGETCIIVHSGGRKYAKQVFSGISARDPVHTEEEYVFTLILLHELGHIVHHDSGRLADNRPFTLQQITGSNGSVTNIELSADLFAVSQLRSASIATFPFGRSAAAMTVASTMTAGAFNFLNAAARDIIDKGPRRRSLFSTEDTHIPTWN